jgi:hypothetical protein
MMPEQAGGMVRAVRGLLINPQHVMSLQWDQRYHANGPGDSVLVIRLVTGHTHRARHEPHYLDDTDAYAVEAAINRALGEST